MQLINFRVHVVCILHQVRTTPLIVTGFAKTVPIGTTIEIHFMA